MKKTLRLTVIMVCALLVANTLIAESVESYVKKAEGFNQQGKLDEAINVVKTGLTEYPEDAFLTSYLGFYTGMKAGRTENYMEAGRLVQEAFTLLDKAVQAMPDNYLPHFHRGILGVNVPAFLGKLDTGVKDLEFIVNRAEAKTEPIDANILIASYSALADAYEQKNLNDKATETWTKIVSLAPDSREGKRASAQLKALAEKEQPAKSDKLTADEMKKLEKSVLNEKDQHKLTALGYAYIQQKEFEKARETFNTAIKHDSTDSKAYLGLVEAIGALADKGYDETIYSDTDYRTKLAFDVVNITDIAARKCPENLEIRLIKGSIGVGMPFFVGKLDQAMQDLQWLMQNENASDEMKAQALYYLGQAHQKKAMTNWIKIVTDYPDAGIVKDVFNVMSPHMERINEDELKKPVVLIDFILGFQDELAPQTAVWMESKSGQFVKTVYVSGFSGYAKEKQVNLSHWSESSDYKDADAVTAASIDIGHHIYSWDLKDYTGVTIKPGEYKVNVEVAYWPSMQYQFVTSVVKIGNTRTKNVVEEGNLIPYLETIYLPQ
ncbi:DUF2271 domain-containing protein [candidate division KSB1 bacterium]|nr:DUF2271 domain-containing protein [candidate division KSB1 bacterium]